MTSSIFNVSECVSRFFMQAFLCVSVFSKFIKVNLYVWTYQLRFWTEQYISKCFNIIVYVVKKTINIIKGDITSRRFFINNTGMLVYENFCLAITRDHEAIWKLNRFKKTKCSRVITFDKNLSWTSIKDFIERIIWICIMFCKIIVESLFNY